MKNIDKLEDHVKSNHKELHPFTTVLWFYKLLDEQINEPILEDNLEEIINSFTDVYKVLQESFKMRITNKIHSIITHLLPYLKENQTTLLHSTDQTIEATHSKLDQYLKFHGYFRNITDLSSSKKLEDGINAWNCYVLGEINK